MAKKPDILLIALGAIVAAGLAFLPAAAEQSSDLKDALAQNFLAEHEIGRRFHVDPNDLPAPKTGPIVADRSL